MEFWEISGAVVLGISEWSELGSVVDFRWCWGDSGLNWSWNGGGVLLEDRVSLGDELGDVWMELEVLDFREKRRRKLLIFGRGRRRGMQEALALRTLSLRGTKSVEGGDGMLVLSRARSYWTR